MSVLKPKLSIIKKAVLGLIRSSVSKTIYRAEEILLSPCCDPVITGTAVSVGSGLYDVTLDILSAPNFLQKGKINLNGIIIDYDDSGSITVPSVPISGGPGDVILTVVILLQTNYDLDHGQGVFIFKNITITLP